VSLSIRMLNVQAQLEAEIADSRMHRDDVAITYAFALREPEGTVDFKKVNHLIIERWSTAALRYIKEKAWRMTRRG